MAILFKVFAALIPILLVACFCVAQWFYLQRNALLYKSEQQPILVGPEKERAAEIRKEMAGEVKGIAAGEISLAAQGGADKADRWSLYPMSWAGHSFYGRS